MPMISGEKPKPRLLVRILTFIGQAVVFFALAYVLGDSIRRFDR